MLLVYFFLNLDGIQVAMIDFFLRHLQAEKRVSPHTLTAYHTDLLQFESYIAPTPMEQGTHLNVRRWVVSLVEQDLENTSINRKIATLRAYFKYLEKHGKINQNPMNRIRGLKTKKNLPTYLEEKPMEMLIQDLPFPTGWMGVRDQLILELLYGTGIRLSELIGLTLTHVDAAQGKIRVLGKRNKERIVPIPNSVQTLLVKYLNVRPIAESDHLLLTDNHDTMYPMFVQRIVKKYLGYVSTLEKRSPHVLRHTFATHLLNRGADLQAIKELLGHANLAATQIYTHTSIEKLRNIHAQAHPKGGNKKKQAEE